MPEMPEVETLRRGLDSGARDRRIEALRALWPPYVVASAAQLCSAVIGHRVTAVGRRGKLLVLDLEDGWHLLVHLRMSGQIVLQQGSRTLLAGGHPTRSMLGPQPGATTRAILSLCGDRTVYVNDARKFGRIRVVTTADMDVDPFLRRLGPEPLGDGFTAEVLRGRLARHRAASVKAALLDQATVAGIGNVYADECLHAARLDPRRPAGGLEPTEVRRLHQAIRTILAEAVDHGGTSFAPYVNDFRGRGTYLEGARLFGRQGEPCPVCGTTVERIRVAGRGTNWCPRCQGPHRRRST